MTKGPTTIVHKIVAAVQKIGTSNGTKIAEPDYSGEDKSNSAREAWFEEWKTITGFLVASTVQKIAVKGEKVARDKMKTTFGKTISNMKPGDKVSVVRGNVTAEISIRNGQTRLSREAIITTLTTKHKWALEDVMEFIGQVEKQDADAVYISTSTTAE